MELWRFLPYEVYSPAENMAIDEAIMTLSKENTLPTIRFYGWNVPTLSIGYFQKVRDVNLDYIKSQEMGFVRRLTGGRAVLHDRELTYSLIAPKGHLMTSSSVSASYQKISQGLLKGFKKLDLHAILAPKGKQSASFSVACFDAPSDYELLVEGKKIAGSAQTRHKGVLLQHGSILIDWDVDTLLNSLYFSSTTEKEKFKEVIDEKAVAIHRVKEDPIELNEVINAFYEGFQEGLGIQLQEGELTREEQDLSIELIESRYGKDAWTYKR